MNISKQLITGLFALILIGCGTSKKETPTLFTVGDSTVKNGRGDGADGLWGWGDFLEQYLDSTKIKVKNHALGGTSSRTYIDKGLWDPVLSEIKKGDFVLIQFGHNDDGPINDTIRARGTIKGVGEETETINNLLTGKHETVHSYGWYLRKMVNEVKEAGGKPILITPIPRNKWVNNTVIRNNSNYGGWVKQVAEEEKVPYLNLNNLLALEMEKLGMEKVINTYFYDWDATHTNAKGAAVAAKLVAKSLQQKVSFFNDILLNNPDIQLPPKRTIYLIGDSTMADNNNDNAVGWGVPFVQFVDTLRVNVQNRAIGGRSSRTFMNQGHWNAIKHKLTPRDFVIIQFGHNDAGNIDKEKYRGSLPGTGKDTTHVAFANDSTEVVHTFGWYLEQYVKDTKAARATPILCSLTPRNEWPMGKVEQRKDSYIKWTKEIALKNNVQFIDLSDSIATAYQHLGAKKVTEFFPKDHTHTGLKGAQFNASIAAKSLKQLKGCEIVYFIK
ncbi:rhamnogalacturonan acetylesterase [Croceivirga radicis]|uniref:rhamnogalacturonan acetylesterase n=1 Tax=Croceivirga radicis TaxID=1929488 RepID=UPI000255AE5C|nr:rhamnogalacturonan acetylesterase [Croceivirga radicis]